MLNIKDLVFQQRKCLQYPKININQKFWKWTCWTLHALLLFDEKIFHPVSIVNDLVNYFTTRAQKRNQANNTQNIPVSIAHNCAYSIRNL